MTHGHALTAEALTPAHLELLVRHAAPSSEIGRMAARALAAPHVKFYRKVCAAALNDLMQRWPA